MSLGGRQCKAHSSVHCFLITNESQSSYSSAINLFRSILRDDDQPNVIVVDRELAIISGIPEHFPNLKFSYVFDIEEWIAFMKKCQYAK